MDVLPGKEILAHRAGSGTGVAEEVVAGQGEPLLQCSGIKAGADGGVEEDLALPQRLKLRPAQQQDVLVQAGKDHLAVPQKGVQRLVLHARSLGVRLAAAAVIRDVRAEEGQRVGDHPARDAQTHDAHPEAEDLHRLVPQHGHPKTVQDADELVQNVLHNAAVAVVPDAQHPDALFPGKGDVHVGALLGVKAAAHPDVAQIGAAGDDVPAGPVDPIFNRLLKDRIIWMGEEVKDEMANRICAQMLMLAAEDPKKDIWLYINSPGGSITAGMAIYDTMQLIEPDVATVGLGMCASMGQFLLSSGTKGKRFLTSHARVLMHQPSGGIGGTATDVRINAELIMDMKKTMSELTAEQTGHTVEEIYRDNEYDHWFTAQEALEYGFVDKLVSTHDTMSATKGE